MKILTNIDLTLNQLNNARLQNTSPDPTATAGSLGQVVYNTSTNLVRVVSGVGTWDTLTNLLESVAGSGAISVTGIVGKAQTISVAASTGAVPGTMSAADFTKLAAATSANTFSTIVMRDAAGNFTATTVTANLTGTASNATQLNGQLPAYYLNRANHTGTQLAATISDFDTQVRTSRLDQMAAPTSSVGLNSQRITGLADPAGPQDAATKNYVDAISVGLDVKASVRAASTAVVVVTYVAAGGTAARGQITAAPNILDGVTLVLGNRLLLKNQATAAQNGIWVVSTVGTGANGVWDRATDFDSDAEVTAGAFTFVEEGTANGDAGFVLTTNNPITIGGASGTALTFAQFSGAGSILAGNGLTEVGSTISAVGTAGRISVGASIDIDATYVGQASITTLGTISTGVWNATAITIAKGGTGGTSIATAKAALGFATVQNLPLTGVATTYTLAHGLGTVNAHVQIYEVSTGAVVYPDIAITATNVVITFAIAPTSNQYTAIVIG